MKTMKLALLGGAALAVMSAGAYADDLSDLKAQIESLNARVASMEAAPSVPTGYSLLSITEGDALVIPGKPETDKAYLGHKTTQIGILPTADAPASTVLEWSGYARTLLSYTSYNSDDDFDVAARGELRVVGKTDTAVGEVGATVKIRADWYDWDLAAFSSTYSKGGAYFKEAWGWWAMTPELTLGGGYTGSLGNIGYGYDGACNCYGTDWAGVGFDPGDRAQMRLSYASGPMSAAIAIEDAGYGASNDHDGMGVAGEIKYSGDAFRGEISGIWRSGETGWDDAYQVGAGVGFSLGDMASISIGAAMGQNHANDEYWGATILGSMTLSDSVHAEAAYGFKSYDAAGDINAVLAGIYYEPVSQLTIGLEGEWFDRDSLADDAFVVDLVTVFRF